MPALFPSLLLQSNELAEDVWWIVGAAIVLAIVFFLTKKAQYTQRNKNIDRRDGYDKAINKTNYNVSQEGIDGHRTEDLSPEEAREVAKKMRETGQQPTEEEFHDLRKRMRGE